MKNTSKQIETVDIVVLLHFEPDFSDVDDKGTHLEKRWDLEKSPFCQLLLKNETRTSDIVLIRYPHTEDVSRLIYVPKIAAFLEITSKRTTESPKVINVEAEYELLFEESSSGFTPAIMSKDAIVKVLLEDGWKYPE